MQLPVMPPFKPMLAKAVHAIPADDGYIFEPKWDGFRCIVFRDGDEIELGSRNERPLTRYFPELLGPLAEVLPERCVVDGELVIVTAGGLDFDALQQRIHPAESRVDRLAGETPASFVAFDLLALDDDDLQTMPFGERRARLEQLLSDATPPIHLCPTTTDVDVATDWFERFEGAGFDGVMAKRPTDEYQSDKRAQLKVKHKRTADVVVAGYRRHKDGEGIGSLLLGIHDDDGNLNSLGVATSFTKQRRSELVDELKPYEAGPDEDHPWREWADAAAHQEGTRLPGGQSRWNAKKDLSFTPLRCELVAEVAYENLQGGARLRHPARFVRWRPDKTPEQCRYDQLEQIAPVELQSIFGDG
jgi:ATP-dependent DNA ligase